MSNIIYRIDIGNKDGQENAEIKMKRYENYKKKLIESGMTIISEREEIRKRFGRVMVIKIEK